jgi:hypothetical protein
MSKFSATSFHAMTGILFFLVLLSLLPLAPLIPPFGSSEAEVATYYQTYTVSVYVFQYLVAIALLCLLWFLGYLYIRLRREAPQSPLPIIMIAAASVWVGFDFVFTAIFQAFPVLATHPQEHVFLRALSDIACLGFMFNVFPAALVVGVISGCIWRLATWPRWLSLLGVLVILFQIMASTPLLVPDGPLVAGGWITYAAFFVVGLWVALTGFVAVRWEFAQLKQRTPAQLLASS